MDAPSGGAKGGTFVGRPEETVLDPIVVEVEGRISAPLETVFDVFMPIDLTTIMTGYGPLPAVAAVEDQTGDWSEVGESRIIRLADGHAMLETLTRVDRPHSFHYTITELTNVLRLLVSRFHGSWHFRERAEANPGPEVTATAEGQAVAARWRYEFEPRSSLTRPIAWLILRRFWRP